MRLNLRFIFIFSAIFCSDYSIILPQKFIYLPIKVFNGIKKNPFKSASLLGILLSAFVLKRTDWGQGFCLAVKDFFRPGAFLEAWKNKVNSSFLKGSHYTPRTMADIVQFLNSQKKQEVEQEFSHDLERAIYYQEKLQNNKGSRFNRFMDLIHLHRVYKAIFNVFIYKSRSYDLLFSFLISSTKWEPLPLYPGQSKDDPDPDQSSSFRSCISEDAFFQGQEQLEKSFEEVEKLFSEKKINPLSSAHFFANIPLQESIYVNGDNGRVLQQEDPSFQNSRASLGEEKFVDITDFAEKIFEVRREVEAIREAIIQNISSRCTSEKRGQVKKLFEAVYKNFIENCKSLVEVHAEALEKSKVSEKYELFFIKWERCVYNIFAVKAIKFAKLCNNLLEEKDDQSEDSFEIGALYALKEYASKSWEDESLSWVDICRERGFLAKCKEKFTLLGNLWLIFTLKHEPQRLIKEYEAVVSFFERRVENVLGLINTLLRDNFSTTNFFTQEEVDHLKKMHKKIDFFKNEIFPQVKKKVRENLELMLNTCEVAKSLPSLYISDVLIRLMFLQRDILKHAFSILDDYGSLAAIFSSKKPAIQDMFASVQEKKATDGIALAIKLGLEVLSKNVGIFGTLRLGEFVLNEIKEIEKEISFSVEYAHEKKERMTAQYFSDSLVIKKFFNFIFPEKLRSYPFAPTGLTPNTFLALKVSGEAALLAMRAAHVTGSAGAWIKGFFGWKKNK